VGMGIVGAPSESRWGRLGKCLDRQMGSKEDKSKGSSLRPSPGFRSGIVLGLCPGGSWGRNSNKVSDGARQAGKGLGAEAISWQSAHRT
jgi:hypothetical protein